MAHGRRVAVMYDADQMGFREEATLRGIQRFAEGAGWRLALDRFAVHQPPQGCEGIIAPPRRWTGPHIRRATIPVVCVLWTRRPLGTARVLENRYEAGRVAARHLLEQGYRAARILHRLMQGISPPEQAILLPPSLVQRRSSDRQSLRDPVVARALSFIDGHSFERTLSPLPAVARHSGFTSYQAFVRAFKRHAGLAPSDHPRRDAP